MPRNINPAPQYHIGGQPVVDGKMYYFEAGTNAPKATYADLAETIENSHPVLLDVNGTLPNVFFSGSAKQILTANVNGAEQQVFERDPVGDDTGAGSFEIYSPGIAYQIHNIVVTTDGRFWKSLTNNNIGNDPTIDSGSNWQQIDFNKYWVNSIVFTTGDIVIGSDNFKYISVVGSNLGNDPTIDSGANWQKINGLQDWVIGRTYEAMEEALGSNGRIYRAVIQNSGNDPVTDNGTNWLPAVGKVNKPSNVFPADAATDVLRTPTLTSSAFSVTGGTDTHEYSRWQVATDSGFSSVIYDSDITGSNLTSNQVSMMLDPATTFYFRERYKGEFAGLSDWSDGTSFTTVPDLAEVFNISSTTGTGASRTIVTGVDLSSESGSIWLFNRDAGNFVKRMDTSRGTDELDLGANTADTINAQGVTAYTSSGFTVGTDVNYNGNTNTISAYVYQNRAGFHDTVTYIGNALSRTIAHNLGIEVGAAIFKNRDDTDAQSYFYFAHRDSIGTQPTTRIADVSAQVDSETGAYLGSTSADFSISASGRINESGKNYIVELFAHNPAQGIFCGSYTPTGSSGQKIVTGFPVGKVIFFGNGNNSTVAAGGGMSIADKTTGTGSHIRIESTGSSIVGGSVQSFDSDGFTLDSGRLNNNSFAGDYVFIAIADPALF